MTEGERRDVYAFMRVCALRLCCDGGQRNMEHCETEVE